MRSGTRRGMRAAIAAVAASLLVVAASVAGGATAFADDGELTFTSTPNYTIKAPGPIVVNTELTASATGGWSIRPATVSFTWLRDGIPIDGVDSRFYETTADDVGHQLAFESIATLAGYTDGVTESDSVYVEPTVSISGGGFSTTSPRATHPITFTYSSITPADAQVTYQWSRGTNPHVNLATTPTYTPVETDAGTGLDLTVSATAPGYAPLTYTYETAVVANNVLHPFVAFYVTPVAGVPAVISSGWHPIPSNITYQWNVNGKAITGATKTTFTPPASYVGKRLTVTEVASLDTYADAKYTSAPSAPVNRKFTKIPRPTITGTPMIGHTLKVNVGMWSPQAERYDYTWMVDGQDVGVDAPTFTPATNRYIGQQVTVIVTAEGDGFGPTPSVSSAPSARIVAGQVVAGTVKLPGAGTNNEVWVQTTGWADYANLTYAWTLNGVAISPPGTTYYDIPMDALGKTLAVTVTDAEPGQVPVSARTSVVIGVGSYQAGPVGLELVGSNSVGSTLTVDESNWSPKPAAFRVRWYEYSPTAGDGEKLIGTKSSYTIPSAYYGRVVYAEVIASGPALHDGTGIADTRQVPVGAGTFAGQPTPSVSGTLKVGQTLTAHHGTWSPSSGVTFTYRWLAQAGSATPKAIAGATHSTVKLTAAFECDAVTVEVTAHLVHYVTTTTTSVPAIFRCSAASGPAVGGRPLFGHEHL